MVVTTPLQGLALVYGGEQQPAGHSPQDDGWIAVSIIGAAGMDIASGFPSEE